MVGRWRLKVLGPDRDFLRSALQPLVPIFLTAIFLTPLATSADDLADRIRELNGNVVVRGTVRQPPLASMLARDVQARLNEANRNHLQAADALRNQADWEAFRDVRRKALRESLGQFPPPPEDPKVRVVRSREGPGYRVDLLVYESRPGLLVTANLYRPAKPAASSPGIVLVTSHHQPKHTAARQDMGVTWARAGCLVLIPDHLGHGERRQHPFAEPAPHDYHFRYDNGIQLHLVGESLMGWLVWDLWRGVDVLLAQPGIDPQRIVMISEPAGGGDVAAVAAALDPRITGVMVNNFGGPEPETGYPLPKDAVTSFDYSGSGSWESTRNLRLSARDGFLPWVIVASVAPRKLIYYHEFYWDRDHDPVWRLINRVYNFHGEGREALTGLNGWGFVVGSEPDNTHWLPVNRELLYPVLERWFSIPNPRTESSHRRPADELLCLSPELKSRPLSELLTELGAQRRATAHETLSRLPADARRQRLRKTWTDLVGWHSPDNLEPAASEFPGQVEQRKDVVVERLHLLTEPGIVVPTLLLRPTNKERPPVVIGVSQAGKQEFLRQRSQPIAELLSAGYAVCLPDVRGTGETSPGESRDRRSAATSLSSSELMLGQSLLGGRLRDLRAVLKHLRSRSDLEVKRTVLWGDSFAPVNGPNVNLHLPHTGDRPPQCEPLGGLLAMLGGLFEDDVQAVYVHGGLSDFHSALQTWTCYLPHDVVVPGVVAAGDLPELAAGIAPRRLWLNGLVDGLNRPVSAAEVAKRYAAAANVRITANESVSLVDWLR